MFRVAILIVTLSLPLPLPLLSASSEELTDCGNYRLPNECRGQQRQPLIVECTISAEQFDLWPQELVDFKCLRILRFSYKLLDSRALTIYNWRNSRASIENHLRKITDSVSVFYRRNDRFKAYKRKDVEPNDLMDYVPVMKPVPSNFQDCVNDHCHWSREQRILECHNREWTSIRFVFTLYVTIPCVNRIVYLDFRGSALRNKNLSQLVPAPFQFPNAIALNLEHGSIDHYSIFASFAPELVLLRLPNDHYRLAFYMNVSQTLEHLAEIRTEWKTYWIYERSVTGSKQIEVFERDRNVIRTYDLNYSQFEINSLFCRIFNVTITNRSAATVPRKPAGAAKPSKRLLWPSICWIFAAIAFSIALINMRRGWVAYQLSLELPVPSPSQPDIAL